MSLINLQKDQPFVGVSPQRANQTTREAQGWKDPALNFYVVYLNLVKGTPNDNETLIKTKTDLYCQRMLSPNRWNTLADNRASLSPAQKLNVELFFLADDFSAWAHSPKRINDEKQAFAERVRTSRNFDGILKETLSWGILDNYKEERLLKSPEIVSLPPSEKAVFPRYLERLLEQGKLVRKNYPAFFSLQPNKGLVFSNYVKAILDSDFAPYVELAKSKGTLKQALTSEFPNQDYRPLTLPGFFSLIYFLGDYLKAFMNNQDYSAEESESLFGGILPFWKMGAPLQKALDHEEGLQKFQDFYIKATGAPGLDPAVKKLCSDSIVPILSVFLDAVKESDPQHPIRQSLSFFWTYGKEISQFYPEIRSLVVYDPAVYDHEMTLLCGRFKRSKETAEALLRFLYGQNVLGPYPPYKEENVEEECPNCHSFLWHRPGVKLEICEVCGKPMWDACPLCGERMPYGGACPHCSLKKESLDLRLQQVEEGEKAVEKGDNSSARAFLASLKGDSLFRSAYQRVKRVDPAEELAELIAMAEEFSTLEHLAEQKPFVKENALRSLRNFLNRHQGVTNPWGQGLLSQAEALRKRFEKSDTCPECGAFLPSADLDVCPECHRKIRAVCWNCHEPYLHRSLGNCPHCQESLEQEASFRQEYSLLESHFKDPSADYRQSANDFERFKTRYLPGALPGSLIARSEEVLSGLLAQKKAFFTAKENEFQSRLSQIDSLLRQKRLDGALELFERSLSEYPSLGSLPVAQALEKAKAERDSLFLLAEKARDEKKEKEAIDLAEKGTLAYPDHAPFLALLSSFPLAPAQALSVSAKNASLSVNFQPSPSDRIHYDVFLYETSPSGASVDSFLGMDSTAYTFVNLKSNTPYFLKVLARRGNAESSPLFGGPYYLFAEVKNVRQSEEKGLIAILFDLPFEASGARIERGENALPDLAHPGTPIPLPQRGGFSDPDVQEGVDYYYWIRAEYSHEGKTLLSAGMGFKANLLLELLPPQGVKVVKAGEESYRLLSDPLPRGELVLYYSLEALPLPPQGIPLSQFALHYGKSLTPVTFLRPEERLFVFKRGEKGYFFAAIRSGNQLSFAPAFFVQNLNLFEGLKIEKSLPRLSISFPWRSLFEEVTLLYEPGERLGAGQPSKIVASAPRKDGRGYLELTLSPGVTSLGLFARYHNGEEIVQSEVVSLGSLVYGEKKKIRESYTLSKKSLELVLTSEEEVHETLTIEVFLFRQGQEKLLGQLSVPGLHKSFFHHEPSAKASLKLTEPIDAMLLFRIVSPSAYELIEG